MASLISKIFDAPVDNKTFLLRLATDFNNG